MWFGKIKLILIAVLFTHVFIEARVEYASKGRVTETLFILQNKQDELSQYIQSLKKKLTECSVQEKKLGHQKIELNICGLYQKLLPSSIHELELLARSARERITQFSQDESVREALLNEAVEKAFLVKEKCELESSILDLLISNERLEWHTKDKQKKMWPQHRFLQLRRDYSFNKKRLRNRQARLAKMNDRLYTFKGSDQKTLLHELHSIVA